MKKNQKNVPVKVKSKTSKKDIKLDDIFEFHGLKSFKNEDFIFDLRETSMNLTIKSDQMRYHLSKIYNFSIYIDNAYNPILFLSNQLKDSKRFFDLDDLINRYPTISLLNYKESIQTLYNIFITLKEKCQIIKSNYEKTKIVNSFLEISFIFQSKDEIVFKDDTGKLRGGKIDKFDRFYSPFSGFYYKLDIDIITFAHESFKNASTTLLITSLKSLISQGIQKIDDAIISSLSQRGEKYIKFMTDKNKCWYYNSEAQFIARFGLITKKINTKIILDLIYHDEINPSGNHNDSIYIYSHDDKISNLDPSQYWMLPAYFKGISLKDKTPLMFDIEEIKSPTWDKYIFDHLEMDNTNKSIIMACVDNYNKVTRSIVDGKNDGLILLLNGPPGVGKTLTAEAVSELTERPLYKISIGDLGTEISSLEQNLKNILERAAFWNAILLIDEADVFLEKRNSNNLQQNYYVSIFLRLLEYFDGIMFLTTNRVENIDRAFLSRITIPLNYGELTLSQKTIILKNLFVRNNITFISDSEIEMLSNMPLNGRQYGSIIKVAVSIAMKENRPLTFDDIKSAAKIHTSFENYLT